MRLSLYVGKSNFTLFFFRKNDLLWKDKFNSPRCESPPSINIYILWWNIYIIKGNDDFWEQWLWIKYYKGTKETWPWVILDESDYKCNSWKEYPEKYYKTKPYLFWKSYV